MQKWIETLEQNNILLIKKLIKEGNNVNDCNEQGENVLALAIQKRCDKTIIDLLIEQGADIFSKDESGISIFDQAIIFSNVELTQKMIEQGTDVNTTSRESKMTPLMEAACYGRCEVAQILLDNGADMNAKDIQGYSAADFARRMRKKKMTELFDSLNN